MVRDRDNHKKTRAKDTGVHHANSAQETEDHLANKMVMAFKELAVATEETINLAVGYMLNPPAAETSNNKLVTALITLTMEVSDLKKSRKNKGGGNGNGTTANAARGGGEEEVQALWLPHLNKVPEELCCELEEDASEVPKWYLQARQG